MEVKTIITIILEFFKLIFGRKKPKPLDKRTSELATEIKELEDQKNDAEKKKKAALANCDAAELNKQHNRLSEIEYKLRDKFAAYGEALYHARRYAG